MNVQFVILYSIELNMIAKDDSVPFADMLEYVMF